jgi:hypothetical protein
VTSDYHSALAPDVDSPPLDGFQGSAGYAFTYDLTTPGPLPEVYDRCDVFYTDLPWRDGYAKFNERAGINDAPGYREFLAAVSRHVEALTAPVVLVTGKHAAPHLPPGRWEHPVKLNGGDAVAYGWRLPYPPVATETTRNILAWLARDYGCVGDFCCGYGRAGRVFTEAGRQFVMSDINARCIGYIAEHETDWVQARWFGQT